MNTLKPNKIKTEDIKLDINVLNLKQKPMQVIEETNQNLENSVCIKEKNFDEEIQNESIIKILYKSYK